MDSPGIRLTCPAAAVVGAPIPIEIEMGADVRTYWDNDGILDKALSVAIVRRDAPGLRFLEKIDPHALMLPDEPLPGRPSDVELDADPGMVCETKQLDAHAGHSAAGAGEYFVTAAFSKWWGGLRSLRVEDPTGSVLPGSLLTQGPGDRPWPTEAPASPRTPQIRLGRHNRQALLYVPIQTPATDPGVTAARGPHTTSARWLTLLGFNLGTRGGACGGLFALEADLHTSANQHEVAIPLSTLAPRAEPGRWVFLAFVGSEILPVSEVRLGHDDVY